MRFGKQLHELWRLRLGVALCALLALVVAVTSVYTISLLPPRAEPRALEIGAASTRVLVDSPKSKIVDIRAGLADFQSFATRADLLGNVMASGPVREYIARRAKVPIESIEAKAPIVADVPRAAIEPGSEQRATDILRATKDYRLNIVADPAVPILNVAAQAPTAEAAGQLANAAVDGLRDYLKTVGAQQKVADTDQVRIVQLGRARGTVINEGVGLKIGLLTFVVVFALAGMAAVFLSRVRRGWRMSVATRNQAVLGNAASAPDVR